MQTQPPQNNHIGSKPLYWLLDLFQLTTIQIHPRYVFFLLKFCLDFFGLFLPQDLLWNLAHDLVSVPFCCHAYNHIAMVFPADLFDAKRYCSFWQHCSSLSASVLAEKYMASSCHSNQCLFSLEFDLSLPALRFRSWKCFRNSPAQGTEKGWWLVSLLWWGFVLC